MKVARTFNLPGNDPVETAPIVWDETVYVTSGHDDVFALDYQERRAQMAVPAERNKWGFRAIEGSRSMKVWCSSA